MAKHNHYIWYVDKSSTVETHEQIAALLKQFERQKLTRARFEILKKLLEDKKEKSRFLETVMRTLEPWHQQLLRSVKRSLLLASLPT